MPNLIRAQNRSQFGERPRKSNPFYYFFDWCGAFPGDPKRSTNYLRPIRSERTTFDSLPNRLCSNADRYRRVNRQSAIGFPVQTPTPSTSVNHGPRCIKPGHITSRIWKQRAGLHDLGPSIWDHRQFYENRTRHFSRANTRRTTRPGTCCIHSSIKRQSRYWAFS